MSEANQTNSGLEVLANATTITTTTTTTEAATDARPPVPVHDASISSAAHHPNIDTLSNQAQRDTPNLSPKTATLPAHLHNTVVDHNGDDEGNTPNYNDNHNTMPYLQQQTVNSSSSSGDSNNISNGYYSSSQQQQPSIGDNNIINDDALATSMSATTSSSSSVANENDPLSTAAPVKDHKHSDQQYTPSSSSSTPTLPPTATFAEAEYLGEDSNSNQSPPSSASANPLRVSIPPKLTSTLPLAKRKSRIDPESRVGRRLAAMAEGRNENGRDLDEVPPAVPSVSNKNNSKSIEDDLADLPDASDFPDSFWDELLRQDQTTVSRSASTMPNKSAAVVHPKTPTSAPITTVPWRSTSFVNPLTGASTNTPSSVNGALNNNTTTTASSTAPSSATASRQTSFASLSTKPSFDTTNSGSTPTTPGEEISDPQMELRMLQLELLRTKDGKTKAEEDAKSQRAAVMSLKTEVQLVRNVLKRRETELGDVKEMSNAYETELAGLRKKLEQAERQLAKGNGELEAKIRALERLRDESIERIKVLDEQLKTLKTKLAELEKKYTETEKENKWMKEELEELAPLREELEKRKDAAAKKEAEESAKIQELTAQIQDLEDTRDCQAAMIEELEIKLKTVETEAQEFKSKAELEYEALSEGFKEIKTRRSEEIKALRVELEQHKLQEQIIEKLQADIDQLQEALNTIASSHSTENARLNQVTAELNEALAEKDEEVRTARQNLTEFEESHNRLVASLQETLATINEEAEAARKSRDEAVVALESLREELEALRHTLPINQKHMSLSQWSEEQQKLQQEQLKVIQDLETKVHGQVDGVKEGRQRAEQLEANTKRKSQQLVEILQQHLQLSNAFVSSQTAAEATAAMPSQKAAASSAKEPLARPLASIPVRTMLNYLTQLRAIAFEGKTLEQQEDTESSEMEERLKAFLATLDDDALMEPWAREKELETEISQLQSKIEALLSDAKDLKEAHARELEEERRKRNASLSSDEEADEDRIAQEAALTEKTRELQVKELFLKEREDFLAAKEQEIQLWEQARARRQGSKDGDDADEQDASGRHPVGYPATPPLSAGVSPVGSPGNHDLLSNLIAAHREERSQTLPSAPSESGDSDLEVSAVANRAAADEEDKATQQEKLIAELQAKIAQLEAQALQQQDGQPKEKDNEKAVTVHKDVETEESKASETAKSTSDEEDIQAAFPSPPQRRTRTRPGSIPRLSVAPEGSGWRASTYLSGLEIESISSNGILGGPGLHGASSAGNQAKIEHLENELALMKDENHELLARLEAIEAELELARAQPAELEEQLAIITETAERQEAEVEELRAQNHQQSGALDRLQEEIIEAENQIRGLQGLKQQLEQQIEQERRAKDEAIRAQEHLRQQLEEEMQKKKGGFLCF
ncbi:hypothetical protein BGW42_002016 [Actinomortierella wolfii]|nr:hypothetical protein BGW42_002016 [Actinomortierella wolfii]